MSEERLDAGPLLALIPEERAGMFAAAWSKRYNTRLDHALRTLWRMRKLGWTTMHTADKCCVVLGIHLSRVYPELYEEAS